MIYLLLESNQLDEEILIALTGLNPSSDFFLTVQGLISSDNGLETLCKEVADMLEDDSFLQQQTLKTITIDPFTDNEPAPTSYQ